MIHPVIQAFPAVTVEASQRNPRRELRNTKQDQKQQRNTNITHYYSINYAKQQRITD